MYSFDLKEALKLTLKYHNRLSPKLWKAGGIQPELGARLVALAHQFAAFSGVDRKRIKDIVVTGSSANYNYTVHSDIDVHIISDVSGINSLNLYQKKVEWTRGHPELVHRNFPLEFYIHDVNQPLSKDQGVYSLVKNKWLNKPTHLDDVSILTDPLLFNHLQYNIDLIKKVLLKTNNASDILRYKEKLWRMRTAGLQRDGEFSIENIIYKDLRNRGLIDKLNTRLREIER